MSGRRREGDHDPLAEHAVTDEHRAAAAAERARSQSQTKFFTPVGKAQTTQPEAPSESPTGPVRQPPPRDQQAPAADSQAKRPKRGQRKAPDLGRSKRASDTGVRPATPLAENATYGPELPGESQVQLVLDLALRIGEVQMASGASAADTTETIQAVTSAYGLPHCEVDVIFSSITVSVHRGRDVNPITAVRLVRARGSDYTRLEATDQLLQRILAGNGKFRPYEASTELDRITKAEHPYPRWVATSAWAGMAASVAVLISGNSINAGGIALLALIAAVISALVDRIGRFMNQRSLPTFFQQLVGGLFATLLALVIVHAAKPVFTEAMGQLGDQLIVGSAITVLLSGLSVVSTVQDAVTGYYVTAAGRTTEVALISAGLIAGVVIAVRIGTMVGLTPGEMGPPALPSVYRTPVLTISGAAAAAAFALASYARKRTLLVAATAGALGGATYGILLATSNSPITAAAVAAVVVGFAGGALARKLRIPPVIVAVAGLTPLLPGFTTYRALYELAVSENVSTIEKGAADLVVAVSIALALGAGVVLGQVLAQPVRRRLGRLQRRFIGPQLSGPRTNPRRREDP